MNLEAKKGNENDENEMEDKLNYKEEKSEDYDNNEYENNKNKAELLSASSISKGIISPVNKNLYDVKLIENSNKTNDINNKYKKDQFNSNDKPIINTSNKSNQNLHNLFIIDSKTIKFKNSDNINKRESEFENNMKSIHNNIHIKYKAESFVKNNYKNLNDSNISKPILEDVLEDKNKCVKINIDKAKSFLPTVNVKSSLNQIFYNKNNTFTDLNSQKNIIKSENGFKDKIEIPKSYKENLLVPNFTMNIPNSRFEKFQYIKYIQRDDLLNNTIQKNKQKKLKYLNILNSINKIYSSSALKLSSTNNHSNFNKNDNIDNIESIHHIENYDSNNTNIKVEEEIDLNSKTKIGQNLKNTTSLNENNSIFFNIDNLIDETKKSINFIKEKNIIGNYEASIMNKSIKKLESFEKFCKRKDIQKVKENFYKLQLKKEMIENENNNKNNSKEVNKFEKVNRNVDIMNNFVRSFNKNENRAFFSTEINFEIPKAGKILNMLNISSENHENVNKNLMNVENKENDNNNMIETKSISEYKNIKLKNGKDREKRLELSKSPHKLANYFFQKDFDETVNELYFNEEIIPEIETPYDRIDIKEFVRISDKILKKKFKTSKMFNQKDIEKFNKKTKIVEDNKNKNNTNKK